MIIFKISLKNSQKLSALARVARVTLFLIPFWSAIYLLLIDQDASQLSE